MNEKIKQLTVSATLLALGTVLSFITVYKMPLGGSITLFSMAPVILISVLYGVKSAIAPCLLFGAIQAFIGGIFGWGLTPGILIGSLVFDYLAAFGVLSLAGIFAKHGLKGVFFGTMLAVLLRFLCHFASGLIFFRTFDVFGNPALYSLIYNGTFMLPEFIMTAAVVPVLTAAVRRALKR